MPHQTCMFSMPKALHRRYNFNRAEIRNLIEPNKKFYVLILIARVCNLKFEYVDRPKYYYYINTLLHLIHVALTNQSTPDLG